MTRTVENRRPRRHALLAIAAAGVLLLGACGDDKKDDASTTSSTSANSSTTAGSNDSTTTTKSGTSAVVIRFDKEIQGWLNAVGCHAGAVDGVIGPETDAAIIAFQNAEGLTPDGEVGTETKAALEKAADAGTTVCKASTSTTTAGGTTTTKAGGGAASCTAGSIGLVINQPLAVYVCSEGYAGGSTTTGVYFILKDEGGKWTDLGQEPCGAASAGIAPAVLEDGCAPAGGSTTTKAGGATTTTAAAGATTTTGKAG